MKLSVRYVAILALLLTAAFAAVEGRAAEPGLFEFRDGDRVVLLGGTFIERMQTDGHFETLVTAAYPKRKITFRNLGWSGDNVWGDSRAVFGTRADGFKRLVDDVKLCEPTVIMVCYGANEAFAGEAGLDDFRAGLNKLLDNLEATGARIVLLGAPQHENLGPPLPDPAQYNADLRKYERVIQAAAQQRKHTFVDLYDWKREKHFLEDDNLTQNGTHLNKQGSRYAAAHLAQLLGVNMRDMQIDIDAVSGTCDVVGASLSELRLRADGCSFVLAPRRLLPDDFAEFKYVLMSAYAGPFVTARFRNLPQGTYALQLDGETLARKKADEWNGETALYSHPARWTALRQAINEKNELFFHRYRPQNETYLFLFRKHEQGNNAVEIPQFDPLIAAKEAEIAKLKQPVAQKFELVKVE